MGNGDRSIIEHKGNSNNGLTTQNGGTILSKSQFAIEYELPNFRISTIQAGGKFKINTSLGGRFTLQNKNNNPRFRYILNRGVVEQTINSRLNYVLTRAVFVSWGERIFQAIQSSIERRSREQGDIDFEQMIIETVTVPAVFTEGQVLNIEWEFGPTPGFSILPPALSLGVATMRANIFENSFGEFTVRNAPIEMIFTGQVVFNFAISLGGWKLIFDHLERRIGIAGATRALRLVRVLRVIVATRAGAATGYFLLGFVIAFAIAKVTVEILRAERARGYRRGFFNIYANGFTRIIWGETNPRPNNTMRQAKEYFQEGVDDALELIGNSIRFVTRLEYDRVREVIKEKLIKALLPNEPLNRVGRGRVAFLLGERLNNGIPLPSIIN